MKKDLHDESQDEENLKEENCSKENEETQSENTKEVIEQPPVEVQRIPSISVTSSTPESSFCTPEVEVYPALPWLQAGEHHIPDGVEEVNCL